MAFDRVIVEENTGVVFDEALSHRIGLVPIYCAPGRFSFLSSLEEYDLAQPSAKYMLKFELHVEATRPGLTPVYSGDLRWIPLPGQDAEAYPAAVVNQKILLTKLAIGQRVKLTAFAIKGIGMVHAKFCPVSCASYRLAPVVELTTRGEGLEGNAAKEFVERCPMGVFEVEETGSVRVGRASACTSCRECVRGEEEKPLVRLARKKDEILFTVESVGHMSAREIVRTALRDFAKHCRRLKTVVLNAPIKEKISAQ